MPAWSLASQELAEHVTVPAWTSPITREEAFGDCSGEGTRICLVDSGVVADDPRIGALAATLVAERGPAGRVVVNRDAQGDVAGHGTACAGIIRRVAPRAGLTSLRILDARLGSPADVLVQALEWAVEEGFDVVNLSLSTNQVQAKEALHDLADRALFRGQTIVAAAHNSPLRSYPWAFAAAISVGSHGVSGDPELYVFNPTPPVMFYAPGMGLRVPGLGLSTITTSGNSFAAPHVSGYCARILAAHPGTSPAVLRAVLAAVASNVVQERSAP